jgi:site-specific recombinase XerD
MRPPDELGVEEVHAYLGYMAKERQLAWNTCNLSAVALRFFYREALKRDWADREIPYQKRPARRLPHVLNREEVAALLAAPPNLKHRAVLATIYAGGLRVGEAVRLRVSDVDSRRMVLRVDQGKGRKDRYVMLAQKLLALLREYWREERPRSWLFPGAEPDAPLTTGSVWHVFKEAQRTAGVTKRVSVHSLRHAFATHLLERGVNLVVIQRLLGHGSVRSTEIYTHVGGAYLKDTPSPLDDLVPDLGRATEDS